MAKGSFEKHLIEIENKSIRAATIPQARAIFKQKFSFSHLPFEEQIIIWETNWKNSSNYRARLQSFFYIEAHALKKEHIDGSWEILKHWQDHVDDWSFCDSLSKIYTKHLEVFQKEVYAQLKRWNKDKDPWKRRQSIVSLLYYSRTKKTHLPYHEIIPLIDNLLHDKEYYVQKGVGWSLRELYNVYPGKTFAYLKKNIKSISAIAFYAATEKLTKKEKDLLKSLRK